MAKTLDKAKASMVAELLRRIDKGEEIRQLAIEAYRIAENIGPLELAAAGRSLLNDGYTSTIVDHLSAAFLLMRRYGQQLSGPKERSQERHILQRVTAEHAVFRCLAAELSDATARLRATECISDTSAEYRQLVHVVSHLCAMKEHFEREDDVILPYLRRLGWGSVCAVVENDHAQLNALIASLTSLVTGSQSLSPEAFQAALVRSVDRFFSCLSEHLSFEDGLLWPLALVVIDNPAVWRMMKTVSEEIGYCGIHVA
jgi:DUF438 domain-containing protein